MIDVDESAVEGIVVWAYVGGFAGLCIIVNGIIEGYRRFRQAMHIKATVEKNECPRDEIGVC